MEIDVVSHVHSAWSYDATWSLGELTAQFGIPTVGTGAGYAHSNGHAPNENIRLDDFFQHMKHVALIFERFARATNGA